MKLQVRHYILKVSVQIDLLKKESNEEFDLWNNLLFWLAEISIEGVGQRIFIDTC